MLADAERCSRVMVFGVGAFTQGVMTILGENGAETSAFLTRNYGHYAARVAGPCPKGESWIK